MYDRYFVDAGAWIAYFDEGDDWSPIVKPIFSDLTESHRVFLITSNLVIYEFVTRLRTHNPKPFTVDKTLSFVKKILEQTEIVTLTENDLEETLKTVKKFNQLPLSGADASSISIMERQGIEAVLTTDKHFIQCGLFSEVRPNLAERGGR
jgi:predicted nucleic acid-binding protein